MGLALAGGWVGWVGLGCAGLCWAEQDGDGRGGAGWGRAEQGGTAPKGTFLVLKKNKVNFPVQARPGGRGGLEV